MKPLPSIRQLHYLVMLSEHLNFTRAAEACFVTQSTLSAGVRELEALLGVKLVERDRQTVLMTPVGDDITQRTAYPGGHPGSGRKCGADADADERATSSGHYSDHCPFPAA